MFPHPDLSMSNRPFAYETERVMALPADLLYRAWTEQLDWWFAAPGSVRMTVAVDAPFFFETEYGPEAGSTATRQPHYGRFLRLERDRVVEMTWVTGAEGTKGAETVVTVELTPTGTSTRLRLTHAGFPDAASRDQHARAWPIVLEHLEGQLARAPDREPATPRFLDVELVRNDWGVIIDHQDLVELRWLRSTSTMTDGGFMATLCLFASEAEKARRWGLLIDATDFRHTFGAGLMEWRDAHIIPRYGAAGVRKFAFLIPAGFPNAGSEAVDGPAVFPTRWFVGRQDALNWLRA